MRRTMSVLLVLASAAACQRRSQPSPLDHDTTATRTTSSASQRVDAVLEDVSVALANADTASAEDALASAVTVAGSDAELVASVADKGLALGLPDAAALGYRRYLAIAPTGPQAGQARMKLSMLTAQAASSTPSAVAVKPVAEVSTPARARSAARATPHAASRPANPSP